MVVRSDGSLDTGSNSFLMTKKIRSEYTPTEKAVEEARILMTAATEINGSKADYNSSKKKKNARK